MSRRGLRALGAGTLAALWLLPAAPVAAAPSAASGEVETGAAWSAWIERFEETRRAIEQAELAYQRAQQALRDQRQRHYPRGPAKRELLAAVEEARRDLEAARAALPALLEEARRAGAPPGVLRPYEDLASRPGG